MATTERVLGADHPNTARSKANLASLLIAKGDAAAAEALIREAAASDRRVFGDQGQEYAQSLNSLSLAVEVQGRLRCPRRILFCLSVGIAIAVKYEAFGCVDV